MTHHCNPGVAHTPVSWVCPWANKPLTDWRGSNLTPSRDYGCYDQRHLLSPPSSPPARRLSSDSFPRCVVPTAFLHRYAFMELVGHFLPMRPCGLLLRWTPRPRGNGLVACMERPFCYAIWVSMSLPKRPCHLLFSPCPIQNLSGLPTTPAAALIPCRQHERHAASSSSGSGGPDGPDATGRRRHLCRAVRFLRRR